MSRILLRPAALCLALALLAGIRSAPPSADFRVARGQLTFDMEGLENPGGFGHSRVLHWPGGASGVTIGRGYDMKERKAAEIEKDLTDAGVDPAVAKQYAQGAKLEGPQAEKFVNENRELIKPLEPAQQKKLFEAVYKEYERRVRKVSDSPALVEEFGKVDWKKLNPALFDLLVDLSYRGDYALTRDGKPRQIVRLLQKSVVANDLQAFYEILRDRDAWRGVPCDRFYRRIDYCRQALVRAAREKDAGGTGPKRIIYDENAPKGANYRNARSEAIGKAAAQLAREAGYAGSPDGPARFVRDLGRKVWGADRLELQGSPADQYGQLKSSPFVERLWLPERLAEPERKRLTEARELLQKYRAASQELTDARKGKDAAEIKKATAEVAKLRKEAQVRAYCLRLALKEAQARADEGDAVLAFDAKTGRGAWIVPRRGPDAELRPAKEWADIPLPHSAQAGRRAEGYSWLDQAFDPVESIEHLSLFVLKRPAR